MQSLYINGEDCRPVIQVPTMVVPLARQSTGDVPGNANFIIGYSDWRSTQNDNLWQGVSGVNNPCPTGFRLPTQSEWATLVTDAGITNDDTAYSSTLKLPLAGFRDYGGGGLYFQGVFGFYWSSSPDSTCAYYLVFYSGGVDPTSSSDRADGFWVRCLSDLSSFGSGVAATALDKSGNGNTGTLNGMTQASAVPGKIGQALKFDGSSGYVVTPYSSSLKFGTGNFSVSAWVNGSGNPYKFASVISANRFGVGESWNLAIGDNTNQNLPSFQVWGTGSGSNYADGPSNINDGKWHHLVAVRNGTTAQIFVDGVAGGINTISSSWNSDGAGANVYIGALGDNPSGVKANDYFNGSIDDVRIYNRALSASEVQQLYDLGTATHVAASPKVGPTTSCTSGLSCGLVGYWTFDGKDTPWTSGSAATTLDKSGNGNTGTLTNMLQSTAPVPGKIGQALKFSNGGDVSIPQSAALFSVPFTYSFWFKSGGIILYRSQSGGLFVNWVSGGKFIGVGQGYNCPTLADTLNLEAWGESTNMDLCSTFSLTPGVWYFGTITADTNNLLKLYINGVYNNSQTMTYPADISSHVVTLGNSSGVLDDVRIYNRALSAGEVKQLYNMGR